MKSYINPQNEEVTVPTNSGSVTLYPSKMIPQKGQIVLQEISEDRLKPSVIEQLVNLGTLALAPKKVKAKAVKPVEAPVEETSEEINEEVDEDSDETDATEVDEKPKKPKRRRSAR